MGKKNHNVGTRFERGNNDNSNTEKHDRLYIRLGTGTSIKSGGVKLV